jgi:hypothetical protein
LLGNVIVFMVCISFPESNPAKLVSALNGILASCLLALIGVNHFIKGEDKTGRKAGVF